MNILEQVIQEFDSQRDMATHLKEASGRKKFTAMNITQWKTRGIPPYWARIIQKCTNGKYRASDIRPDFFETGETKKETPVERKKVKEDNHKIQGKRVRDIGEGETHNKDSDFGDVKGSCAAVLDRGLQEARQV